MSYQLNELVGKMKNVQKFEEAKFVKLFINQLRYFVVLIVGSAIAIKLLRWFKICEWEFTIKNLVLEDWFSF